MRLFPALVGVVMGLVAWGCASDDRQWMKVGEKYTTAEFRRDYTECSRRGTLDEACLRGRGWVDVKAGKPEEKPQAESYRQQRGKILPGQAN
jgi:hypothetical protein